MILAGAAPVLAQAPQPSAIAATADARLRSWLAADAKIQEKLAKARKPAAFAVETDLRDAVADRPSQAPQSDCADFQSCPSPALSMDVAPGESAETAIRAMLRPWILLTDASGARLGVAGGSDAQTILVMNIKDLGLAGVGLNAEPRAEGGMRLWFSREPELAAVYARERAKLAPSAKP